MGLVSRRFGPKTLWTHKVRGAEIIYDPFSPHSVSLLLSFSRLLRYSIGQRNTSSFMMNPEAYRVVLCKLLTEVHIAVSTSESKYREKL
jgi:hypothetical protein